MKRFITVLLIIAFILLPCIITTSRGLNSYNYSNRHLLEAAITEQESRMESAADMAAAARKLGYPEEHEIIQAAKVEWGNAYKKCEEYRATYIKIMDKHEAHLNNLEGQYPAATNIWHFLKNEGYNDYVCAGILGNMMIEVGGGTLNLKYDAYGQGYYGICQWSRGYSEVWGTSLGYQCEFLRDTIQYEFNVFGKLYRTNFDYNSFLKLANEREAALAFAKVYERCSSKTYTKRQNCAAIAYDIFVR